MTGARSRNIDRALLPVLTRADCRTDQGCFEQGQGVRSVRVPHGQQRGGSAQFQQHAATHGRRWRTT